MSISLKQFAGSVVAPVDDATWYEFIYGKAGFFKGCEPSFVSDNVIHITAGYGVIQGRVFEIEAEDIAVDLSNTDTLGRLKVVVDTTDASTPISFESETASGSLPALTQQDINGSGTIFELAVATYDVGSTAISNMVDARVVLYSPQVSYGSTDLVAGTDPLATGSFYFVYE